MKKVVFSLLATLVLAHFPVDDAAAETKCNAIVANESYLCVEDRFQTVVPGQEWWIWSVSPDKGQFSPVDPSAEAGWSQIYTCDKNSLKYTATISVAFRAPAWLTTSTTVLCDASIQANDGAEDEECEDCEYVAGIGDEGDDVPFWDWAEDWFEQEWLDEQEDAYDDEL